MTMKIDAIIYSYKNKNLKLVVESLISKTNSEIFIKVFDQNPIDRTNIFSQPNVSYEYIAWDKIDSPSERKGNAINQSSADYILEISDDCIVSDNWDKLVIEFVEKTNCVVSGNTKIKLIKDGFFFYKTENEESNGFELTNYVNRDFIFSKKEIWKSIQYPYFLKYHGEEELLSLDFFKAGYSIYCSPPTTYKSLNLKNIENLYVPYSKDHNYNIVVDRINEDPDSHRNATLRSNSDFFAFHKIQDFKIKHLPYSTNDVQYNQYGLKFQDIDARKFISKTKSIY